MVIDEGMARRFQQAREERAYWETHYPELLAQYPDEWVAVGDGKVIAHTQHVWDLLQRLDREGLDPRDSWITYLNATRRAISL
jgi:hypothetical protein